MKRYLDKKEIEQLIDSLIQSNDSEIDDLCSNELSTNIANNIKKLSIERIAYRKVKNILVNKLIGE